MKEEEQSEKFISGLEVRRAVLGPEYVDHSLAKATEFTWPIQELSTEYCWGHIWTRPGLPRKTRSLLNLAMMTALNRPHELRIHVRGALRNGCSRDEIKEVLLQATIYCGIPAGMDSFRVAQEVFQDVDDNGLREDLPK